MKIQVLLPQLLLVSAMRQSTNQESNTTSPCTTWPGGYKTGRCCTPMCDGRVRYDQRTQLEDAILSRCTIVEGPITNSRGKVMNSEQMERHVKGERKSWRPPNFPESEYMCKEECDVTWPETDLRPRIHWGFIPVYRSGGVDKNNGNDCISINKVKPRYSKSELTETTTKKPKGIWQKFKGKVKK